jgi:hypothetical protein
MNFSKLTLSLYVGSIFISGVAVGAFSHRLYTVSTVNAKASREPDEFRKRYMAALQSKLKLRPDQVSKLNAILDQTHAKFEAADKRKGQEMQPEYQAIWNEQTQQIRVMLDPEQRPEYEKFRQERMQRRKRRQQEQR